MIQELKGLLCGDWQVLRIRTLLEKALLKDSLVGTAPSPPTLASGILFVCLLPHPNFSQLDISWGQIPSDWAVGKSEGDFL